MKEETEPKLPPSDSFQQAVHLALKGVNVHKYNLDCQDETNEQAQLQKISNKEEEYHLKAIQRLDSQHQHYQQSVDGIYNEDLDYYIKSKSDMVKQKKNQASGRLKDAFKIYEEPVEVGRGPSYEAPVVLQSFLELLDERLIEIKNEISNLRKLYGKEINSGD